MADSSFIKSRGKEKFQNISIRKIMDAEKSSDIHNLGMKNVKLELMVYVLKMFHTLCKFQAY